MHSTLTEYARCLYGDEYGPTPECDRDHQEFLFVERLTWLPRTCGCTARTGTTSQLAW